MLQGLSFIVAIALLTGMMALITGMLRAAAGRIAEALSGGVAMQRVPAFAARRDSRIAVRTIRVRPRPLRVAA